MKKNSNLTLKNRNICKHKKESLIHKSNIFMRIAFNFYFLVLSPYFGYILKSYLYIIKLFSNVYLYMCELWVSKRLNRMGETFCERKLIKTLRSISAGLTLKTFYERMYRQMLKTLRWLLTLAIFLQT